MQKKKVYKIKLTEMPHIDYGDKVFDLELEKFDSIDSFLKYLESILIGKAQVDKYGNIISLKDRNEKSKFIKSLKDNNLFQKFVEQKLSETEQRLLTLLLNLYLA